MAFAHSVLKVMLHKQPPLHRCFLLAARRTLWREKKEELGGVTFVSRSRISELVSLSHSPSSADRRKQKFEEGVCDSERLSHISDPQKKHQKKTLLLNMASIFTVATGNGETTTNALKTRYLSKLIL